MQWKREKLLFHHTLERDIFLAVYGLSPVSLDGLCGIKLHVRCALGLIRVRGDPAVKNITALEGQRSILFHAEIDRFDVRRGNGVEGAILHRNSSSIIITALNKGVVRQLSTGGVSVNHAKVVYLR